MKCKGCDSEVDTTKLSDHASGNFCNKLCAHRFSQSTVNNDELKQGNCSVCGKELGIKKRASSKQVKCDNCRSISKRICKFCGQIKPCKRPDVCKKHQIFPTLIKYFGFDENKIGTVDIYEEFDRVKNMLADDYGDNEMSVSEMVSKYKHYHVGNFHKILNVLNINRRNIGEAYVNYIKYNGLHPNVYKHHYKYGGHKTGNGKDVFYRSSYELEYAKWLDEQETDYEMEGLRILYGDSQLLRQRIAIPDFYLPESNMIIEVKSNWTYDEQNMKDRLKSYRNHGYNFKFILEKEEVKI